MISYSSSRARGELFSRDPGDSAVARWDFISIFILFLSARLWEILSKAQIALNDFPIKAWRAGSSFVQDRTALRGRRPANKAERTLIKRPVGAPAGRSDTMYRLLVCFAPFFVRAPYAIPSILTHRQNRESLLEAAACDRAPCRTELRSGRAGPTSRGRTKLRFAAAGSAQLFVPFPVRTPQAPQDSKCGRRRHQRPSRLTG